MYVKKYLLSLLKIMSTAMVFITPNSKDLNVYDEDNSLDDIEIGIKNNHDIIIVEYHDQKYKKKLTKNLDNLSCLFYSKKRNTSKILVGFIIGYEIIENDKYVLIIQRGNVDYINLMENFLNLTDASYDSFKKQSFRTKESVGRYLGYTVNNIMDGINIYQKN